MKKLLSLILACLTCFNMSLTILAQEPTDTEGSNVPTTEEHIDDGSEENLAPTDPQNPVAPCDDSLPGGSNECP